MVSPHEVILVLHNKLNGCDENSLDRINECQGTALVMLFTSTSLGQTTSPKQKQHIPAGDFPMLLLTPVAFHLFTLSSFHHGSSYCARETEPTRFWFPFDPTQKEEDAGKEAIAMPRFKLSRMLYHTESASKVNGSYSPHSGRQTEVSRHQRWNLLVISLGNHVQKITFPYSARAWNSLDAAKTKFFCFL
ncbi:hypothetical protein PoB_003492900 [Plakobranchus ocellatus]|uniref:Uncharacterized protein n=1 Tax=Plakobranchus ocellatus TaxID=259542 RepID=A0AAV4AQ31_9GAST|nr:hypothetical protein PoB_003492900 [Plakobranchus ocellatus]